MTTGIAGKDLDRDIDELQDVVDEDGIGWFGFLFNLVLPIYFE